MNSLARISARAATTTFARRAFHSSLSRYGDATYHGTTIICVRKNGKVCMMGDGQVSMGNMMVKPNAKKIRVIPPKSDNSDGDAAGGTIVGFAGSTADAFTLVERLEAKLDEYPGQLARSCVELAKGWRTDKYLRRLEASLLVADDQVSLELTGNGDVLESEDGILGVGSGSGYAIGEYLCLLLLICGSINRVSSQIFSYAYCFSSFTYWMVNLFDSRR